MDITAFIMGTCRSQRLVWLEQTMDYLDSQNFPFVKKILAIDEFDGFTFPKRLDDKFADRGWIIIIDSHKSRVKSMDHAFEIIDSEYVFYNEEDVMSTLPEADDLAFLFKKWSIDGKTCSMVSLTLGGSTNHFPGGQYGDLRDVRANIIYETHDSVVFRRLESKRNDFFFEFPGLFVRRDIFLPCHQRAKERWNGLSIEQGLTKAYFDLGYDKRYFKASIAKNNLEHVIETSPNDFIRDCRFLENLDPNQGNSSSGGNHYF